MISQTGEYALRAVLFLARQGLGIASAQDIASATGVPHGYLHKILRMLAGAGILEATRGSRGGFSLARSPAELTVLHVLRSVEGDSARRRRALAALSPAGLARLQRVIEEAQAAVDRAFAGTTIADLAGSSPRPDGTGSGVL